MGHFQTVERQARGGRRYRILPEIARRPWTRLSGPISGSLAVSELPPAPLRCDSQKPQLEALYPFEFHENVAADGETGRSGLSSPYRNVEYDDSQAEASARGRAYSSSSQRNGIASSLPTAGSVRVRSRARLEPVGYSPIGSPATGPNVTELRKTQPMWKIPLSGKQRDRLGIHPAEVCVKWAAQHGHTPIPFSAKPRNILGNLRAVVAEAFDTRGDERKSQASTATAGSLKARSSCGAKASLGKISGT